MTADPIKNGIRCTLFTSLLAALGVPHTRCYSDSRFRSMPFNSLFGLSRLLDAYGIDSEGLELTDKSQIVQLPTPFLAQTDQSFVVVTSLTDSQISYTDDAGMLATEPLKDFVEQWSGIVLAVYPRLQACEPNLEVHRISEVGFRVMRVAIWLLAAFLIVVGLIAGGSWNSPSILLGLALSGAGIYISRLLLLKTLGVKSHAADRVCGVVEEGGCDDILATEASKFFGLFGWSEVGAAYFGITFLVLIAWPQAQPELALLNLCCLPFSFWSVWYQRFRAHAWCTLCLTVQALLWLIAASQLFSGWWREVEVISWSTAVLIALYAFALLAINAIDNFIIRQIHR